MTPRQIRLFIEAVEIFIAICLFCAAAMLIIIAIRWLS